MFGDDVYFDEYMEQPLPSPVEDIMPPPTSNTTINTLDNPQQSTVVQRQVSKVIIFFNDGTYQEM
jgi:hypothetical protein